MDKKKYIRPEVETCQVEPHTAILNTSNNPGLATAPEFNVSLFDEQEWDY